jgi:hypothetical protein
MGRKLAAFVYIDGTRYGPDDTVPPEVAERIVNPEAWVADQEPDPVADDTPPPAQVDANRPAANANRTAWAKYAESLGVAVTGEMKPADIAAAIDKRAQES